MHLVLDRDASQPLANSYERGDPLSRVPATRALVAADLADTDRGRLEPRLLRCAPEELLRHPLALAVAHAVRDTRLDVERLCRSRRVCVVYR